ncbi:MAG: hypothetical protein AAFN30_19930, partial [Actinomycetota bacterium]
IQASRSSLYLLSMHVVAIGVAWFIHDEPLAPLQLLGGFVVFASVAAVISRPPATVVPPTDTGAAADAAPAPAALRERPAPVARSGDPLEAVRRRR